MALNQVGLERLNTATTKKIGTDKNIIINGAMQVAQRGTSSTTSNDYAVDRFKHNFAGTDEAPTFAQVDVGSSDLPFTKGLTKALKVTNGNQTSGAGTGDRIRVEHMIEAQNIRNSGWNYTSSSSYITLSFYVKSSVAQNFYGRLASNDGTAQSYIFETGSLTANTWTKITKTVPGNSNITINNDNGIGLIFNITMFGGTDQTGTVTLNQWAAFNSSIRSPDYTSTWYTTNDATFEITGVQLEVGSVATDFEHRSFADELLKCQRYCYVLCEGLNTPLGNGTCWTASNVFIPVIYPVKMRSGPTMSVVTGTNYYSHFYGGTSANESGANFSLAVSLSTGCEIYDNSTNVTQNASCFSRNQNAACKITLSAEL